MIATPQPAAPPLTGPARAAVVWIDRRHAAIASIDRDGTVDHLDVARGSSRELDYLERVVDELGDRDRLLILGPDAMRSRLEREYVIRFPGARHLVDVEPYKRRSADQLDRQVRELAT